MREEPTNIRPKDLMIINGLSYSRCAEIVRNIRKSYGKQRHQILTIEETAEYLDITADKLRETFRLHSEKHKKTSKN